MSYKQEFIIIMDERFTLKLDNNLNLCFYCTTIKKISGQK